MDLFSRKSRIMAAVLFLILSAFICGCSKKQVKPEPSEVKITSQAFLAIEHLRKAYEAKNAAAAKEATTSTGFPDVTDSFDQFDSATLKFYPKWVDMAADGTIDINVAWDGVWTKDGKKDKEQGMAVFEMTGNPPKLNRVLKGNPFTYPH